MIRKNTKTAIALSASDPENAPLTYSLVQLPEDGKISGAPPNLFYTPDSGFLGLDALTFTVSDGANVSAVATVTITVSGSAVTKTAPVTKKKTIVRKTTTKKKR